jgi:hypothetical protein
MLQQDLTGNHKVLLSSQYQVVAGADKDRVPRLLLVDPQGRLAFQGAELPHYDAYKVDYYPGTNNIQIVHYYVGGQAGTEVARWQFTYVGGGVANDENLATGELVILP